MQIFFKVRCRLQLWPWGDPASPTWPVPAQQGHSPELGHAKHPHSHSALSVIKLMSIPKQNKTDALICRKLPGFNFNYIENVKSW